MKSFRVFSLAAWVPFLFPGAIAAQAPNNGLAWSTYLGGSGDDVTKEQGVRMLGDGDVLVWGSTGSTDFPVRGAFQAAYGGPASPLYGFGDGFLTRFDPRQTGQAQLVCSTYLGGSSQDAILGATVDASGTITVCGVTTSPDFPTTAGAFQTTRQGPSDGFVARFVWNGAQLGLLWSTLLGGSADDTAMAVAVHPTGVVVVAGHTSSTDFPMRGQPFQPAHAGDYDGFLAVLDATGARLSASTFLGGTGRDFTHPNPPFDAAYWSQLVLDQAGNPVVIGWTDSRDFPLTAGAYQASYGGGTLDGVVARLDLGLGRLTYATYLGGSGWDWFFGLALAPDDRIVVSGGTGSPNYPVTPNAFDTVYDPGSSCPYAEGCVTMLDTRRTGAAQLVWSTFFGGTACDGASSLAVDPCGRVTVGGFTQSSDVPTTPGAYQRSRAGGWDGFVAWFDPARSGRSQLLYGSYLGGTVLDNVSGTVVDTMGSAVITGQTQSPNFPTTPGAFQQTPAGGSDAFVARLTLLPLGVERYGASTPACLWPIWHGVDSWPARGNQAFTLLASGVPPAATGAVLLGLRRQQPYYTFLNVTGLVDPIVDGFGVTASALGCAGHGLPIPPSVPQGIQLATQWVFLTSGQCPGTGVLATSEGLEITVQ